MGGHLSRGTRKQVPLHVAVTLINSYASYSVRNRHNSSVQNPQNQSISSCSDVNKATWACGQSLLSNRNHTCKVFAKRWAYAGHGCDCQRQSHQCRYPYAYTSVLFHIIQRHDAAAFCNHRDVCHAAIQIGGLNGLLFSNTLWFHRYLGWRGILM